MTYSLLPKSLMCFALLYAKLLRHVYSIANVRTEPMADLLTRIQTSADLVSGLLREC